MIKDGRIQVQGHSPQGSTLSGVLVWPACGRPHYFHQHVDRARLLMLIYLPICHIFPPLTPQSRIFLMTSPSSPALQQLHCFDASSPNFYDQLYNLLCRQEYVQCIPNLKGDDLVWLVNYLDKALDDLDHSSVASQKCLRELRSICGTKAILPTSYTLSTDLLKIDPDPFVVGGFGDVYRGILNGSSLCIKRVRVYIKDNPQKAAKTFCQEAVMRKYLKHPNILPLLGVTISPLQLISDWTSGGELPQYIEKNPSADRLQLAGVHPVVLFPH
ncbi:hypothetical protein BDM02DRAFT_2871174 [Thelephora ganbajun]|uniref:Uncharacterized protein n=1 Tax=Thelephora ganbajun TaxID=370292 RepID=A0ACB6ZBG7_THEGA|nr:hypothetical protein BDM02DRAFT_2871174 [Thelephora ganbajun]